MIEFLQDWLVKAGILAKSFKRESDNSEISYQNDLQAVANSGSYNDLINKPDTSLDSHNNTHHTETYETTLGAQQKADGAEAAAKTYMDNKETTMNAEITNVNNDIDQLSANMARWEDEFVGHFQNL